MYKQEIPPGRARRDPLWNEISLETDRGHPVPEVAEQLAEFSPYGLVELDEVAVEDGGDGAKSYLVDELHEGDEAVEETEDRGNRRVQVGPEIVVDDVKGQADNETGNDTFDKALGKLLEPADETNLHLLGLLGVDQLLKGKLCFRILLGGDGSGLLSCSVVKLDILVFHVHSP